jgi:hypothetical protein
MSRRGVVGTARGLASRSREWMRNAGREVPAASSSASRILPPPAPKPTAKSPEQEWLHSEERLAGIQKNERATLINGAAFIAFSCGLLYACHMYLDKDQGKGIASIEAEAAERVARAAEARERR